MMCTQMLRDLIPTTNDPLCKDSLIFRGIVSGIFKIYCLVLLIWRKIDIQGLSKPSIHL